MKKLLIFLMIIAFPGLSFAADVDTDVDNNGYIDIAYGGTNAATAADARTSLGVPSTASTLAGSCTVGPCLDGTSDGGDLIKLYGPGGFWTALQAGNAVANRSWRLPLAAAPGAGTTRLMNMDENGQMGFVDPATFAVALGADDNYVTDAEKTVIGNTSGINTGDQTLPVVSDTAYDATTWNANTDAATKNAIRDKIESISSGLTSLPTADNQIIQATGVGTYGWTSSVAGLIDDTAGNGDTDKLLSADRVVELIAAGTGTTHTIASLSMDGGGSDIPDGVKGDKRVPFAAHITTMTITSTASCSAVIDIWKDTYANFPATVADAITGGGKPTLSAAVKGQITGLNIAVTAGDMIRFNVDSNDCTGIVNLYLDGTRD